VAVAGPDGEDTFDDEASGLSAKLGRDGGDDGGCRRGEEDGGTGVFLKRVDCSPSTFQERARDLAASSAWARRLRSSIAADCSDKDMARAILKASMASRWARMKAFLSRGFQRSEVRFCRSSSTTKLRRETRSEEGAVSSMGKEDGAVVVEFMVEDRNRELHRLVSGCVVVVSAFWR